MEYEIYSCVMTDIWEQSGLLYWECCVITGGLSARLSLLTGPFMHNCWLIQSYFPQAKEKKNRQINLSGEFPVEREEICFNGPSGQLKRSSHIDLADVHGVFQDKQKCLDRMTSVQMDAFALCGSNAKSRAPTLDNENRLCSPEHDERGELTWEWHVAIIPWSCLSKKTDRLCRHSGTQRRRNKTYSGPFRVGSWCAVWEWSCVTGDMRNG